MTLSENIRPLSFFRVFGFRFPGFGLEKKGVLVFWQSGLKGFNELAVGLKAVGF